MLVSSHNIFCEAEEPQCIQIQRITMKEKHLEKKSTLLDAILVGLLGYKTTISGLLKNNYDAMTWKDSFLKDGGCDFSSNVEWILDLMGCTSKEDKDDADDTNLPIKY